MQRRLLVLLVLAVALAGCGGSAPTESSDDRATVTPLPVPDSAEDRSAIPDVDEDGVDAERLSATHADTLDDGYTRVVDLTVTGDDVRYLEYRGARTIGASGDVLREREYRGPWTARYVPDVSDAASARSVRYVTDERRVERRTVDGATARTDNGDAPALDPPVPPLDDASFVAALLENATVAERTESGGVRLTATSVGGGAVPPTLEDPRNVSVRATVRGNGRVTHVFVRYEATADGQRVAVTQNVYWSAQSVPVVAPEWADDG